MTSGDDKGPREKPWQIPEERLQPIEVQEAIELQMMHFGEIPDRTSPDDFPEGYVLTRQELVAGFIRILEADRAARSHEAPPASESISDDLKWLRWQADMSMAGDDKFANRLLGIAELIEALQRQLGEWAARSSIAASVADRPRGAYAPFTVREIDLIRAVLDDGTYTAQEKQDIGKLCDMAINCLLYGEEIRRLRGAPPSAIGTPSREDAYRRAFVLLLAEVMASGWFHADPSMKAKVVAYLHTVSLDKENFTVEKVLHDAMGLPTDSERAFVATDGKATHG